MKVGIQNRNTMFLTRSKQIVVTGGFGQRESYLDPNFNYRD